METSGLPYENLRTFSWKHLNFISQSSDVFYVNLRTFYHTVLLLCLCMQKHILSGAESRRLMADNLCLILLRVTDGLQQNRISFVAIRTKKHGIKSSVNDVLYAMFPL